MRHADAAVTALVRSGIRFSGLAVRDASLEEAFLTLTSDPTPLPARSEPATTRMGR